MYSDTTVFNQPTSRILKIGRKHLKPDVTFWRDPAGNILLRYLEGFHYRRPDYVSGNLGNFLRIVMWLKERSCENLFQETKNLSYSNPSWGLCGDIPSSWFREGRTISCECSIILLTELEGENEAVKVRTFVGEKC